MAEPARHRLARWRLEELLQKYPGLRIKPAAPGSLKLVGTLSFVALGPQQERIEDQYEVAIVVPDDFPAGVPSVRETARRIPPSFHKLDDGALCLGSPTRLRLMLPRSSSLVRFVERLVIPYLYGHSYFEKHGVPPFGELQHGAPGLRQDFAAIFGVERTDAVDELVRLTSMRKRHANKQPCPCGSGRRLGRCHHRRVNGLRDRLGRGWFRVCYSALSREARQSRTEPRGLPPLGPRSRIAELGRVVGAGP